MATEYRIPSFAPGGLNINDTNAFTWLVVKAYKLESQKTLSRSSGAVVKGPLEYTFNFLLPEDFAENFSHSWEQARSPVQELAEKVVDLSRGYDQTGQLLTGSVNALTSLSSSLEGREKGGRVNPLKDVNAAMQVGLNLDTKIPGYKVDTMLAYQGSANREWSFSFDLGFKSNRQQEIFEPINTLKLITSPEIDGQMSAIGIKYPYIFSLETNPGSGLIKADNTALRGVVVNWFGPYKNGFPARAKLDLTFTEIEPLYRSNFVNGTSITYNNPGQDAIKAALSNSGMIKS